MINSCIKKVCIFTIALIVAPYMSCMAEKIDTTIALRSPGYNLPMNYTKFNELVLRSGHDNNNLNIPSDSPITIDIRESGNRYGPPIMPSSHHTPEWVRCASQLTPTHFGDLFKNAPYEFEFLRNFHYFARKDFCAFARRLSCYEGFMLALQKRIKEDKHFRRDTAYVPGFKFHEPFWWWNKTKSGFHDFINQEAERILKERAEKEAQQRREEQQRELERKRQLLPRLRLSGDVSQRLMASWQEKLYRADGAPRQHYQQRLAALEKTVQHNNACYDYASEVTSRGPNDDYAEVFANCYGTALDKQLHEELCASRTIMAQVQRDYPGVHQVTSLAPMVNHFAALAKEQCNPEVAFHLSDMCYYLTKAAQGFGNAAVVVAKGLGGGTINLVTHTVALAKYLAVTPVDGIAQDIGYAGIALGKALYRVIELETTNPKLVNIRTKEIALELYRSIRNNPEEAIATIVELLLPFKAQHIFRFKQVQPLITVLREQELIARTMQVSCTIASKAMSPIKAVVTDAAAVVDVGIKRGKAAMQNLITVAEAEPELVSAGDIMALNLPPECFGSVERLEGEIGVLKKELVKSELAILEPIRNNEWKSPAGLIYKPEKKFGNRANHVLSHATPSSVKDLHTVFSVPKDEILKLVDEAWSIKGEPLVSDKAVYIVDMKKSIGVNGESAIRIVVIPGTSEIITAYPVKV